MLHYKQCLDVKQRAHNNNKNSSNDNVNLGKFIENYKNKPSAKLSEFEQRPIKETDGLNKYVGLVGKKEAPASSPFSKGKSQTDKKKNKK